MQFHPSITARFILVACLSFSTAAPAKEKQFSLPMKAGAKEIGASFSSGGEIQIAAMITEVSGRIAVCGFWRAGKALSGRTKSLAMHKTALTRSSVRYNKKKLLVGLRFMNEVAYDDYRVGTKANCKLTKAKWHASMSNKNVELHMPRFRVLD